MKNERIDVFLIWGNGAHMREQIIDEIRNHPYIEILRVQEYHPNNIGEFVQTVYSTDFVPLAHLEGKTKYLMSTKSEVFFVVVRNMAPNEQLVGEGEFQHIQCMHIKSLKEKIRNRYNPRKDGQRTEEHVVHGTDVEDQADELVKMLGIEEGVSVFRKKPNALLDAPYHLAEFHKFSLAKIPTKQLYCNIFTDEGPKMVELSKSPHFQFLRGQKDAYEEYIKRFWGRKLTDDHTVKAFDRLIKRLRYPGNRGRPSYILVRELENGKYLIIDGLHRAAILKYQKESEIVVAVLK